jgi:hypothetical protein
MQPSNLFSCHNSLDGSFVLYLEEQDANLDLLEDVVGQVHLLAYLDWQRIHAMRLLTRLKRQSC